MSTTQVQPAHAEIFRRKEIKYLLDPEHYAAVRQLLDPVMTVDRYGRQTIRSIYYDTPGWDLITRSLQHPKYKEKLRVRGYGESGSSTLFYA